MHVQARLVALVAAQRLGVPMQQMEARLDDLVHLVPDLGVWGLLLAGGGLWSGCGIACRAVMPAQCMAAAQMP
jgi:hypothetical protein